MTWLRWTVIATMLVIALAWPGAGRTGQQLWVLALGFGGYNLAVELVRRSIPRLATYAWVPFVDLPVTGVLCAIGADAGGPLFVGFFLAVLTAANYLSLRFTMAYITFVAVTIVVIVPTLPAWSTTPNNSRQLAVRLVVLVLLGLGTAILSRRLTRSAGIASQMRSETGRLEELDRLRSEFIASVSHDLKTPLISMQAGLGMVVSSAGDRLLPDERRLVDNAQRNVVRLALFIDDLLLVNQIRSRTLVIARRRLDLRDAVSDAVSIVVPLLAQKRQTLDVDLPTPLPVEGESRRLGQVIVNLLANAHTHHPAWYADFGRRSSRGRRGPRLRPRRRPRHPGQRDRVGLPAVPPVVGHGGWVGSWPRRRAAAGRAPRRTPLGREPARRGGSVLHGFASGGDRGSGMTIKVLIAEDVVAVADVVAFGARMTWPGCDVTMVDNGADAIAHAAAHSPDLVVLDVSLPPPDGFEVCRRIREVSQVPILMLTVRDATIDKVRAFDLGADDYLTKPFDHLELVARMRALVRRSLGVNGQAGGGFAHGDLSIDFDRHEVRVGEDVIHLTSTEYRILEELARNAGSTMPHHLLLERVWGSEWAGDPSYLKVFVRRLRQKLGDDAGDPRYIETVWGTGYRLLAPQASLVSP